MFGAGLILWIIFFLGRVYGHHGVGTPAKVLEFLGMNWMGGLFLIFVCLLAADLITGFGLFLPRLASKLRGFAIFIGIGQCIVASAATYNKNSNESQKYYYCSFHFKLSLGVIVSLKSWFNPSHKPR